MQHSLWDTVNIGDLELRNRAVMPAMGTGYSSEEGEATDRLIAYLKRRAEGGVGLIITEVCAVHPLGKGFPSELGIYDDSFLPSLERLAGEVKASGSAVAAQLHHAGRETFPQFIGEQPVAPSPLASRAMGQKPRALRKEEIAELIDCYAAAAVRAKEAGFDAVEIHGAHGYLVSQFLSPYSNRREDEYGGDAEGRFRFAVEIVKEMRQEVGEGFPIIFRFSSTEALKDGYDLEYILPLLPILEEEGVDAFHVSCGVYDSPGNPTCPGLHYPPGINVERAAVVKGEVNIPVIVVGKLHDPRLAEEVISQGKADMVAFGRQHIADPHFLRKAEAGKYEDIRFCLSCNQGCIERLMFEFKPATCTINPECGREWESPGKRPAVKGRFLVVGAGAAGLQAAMDLKEAGAEVELMEREKEAGGQLRAASKPPGKEPYAEWVKWAEGRLHSLGSQIKLGQEAGIETLKEGDWRGVIAATGAKPVIPSLPGVDHDINAEAREVLLGQRETGQRILVVGAGPVGMETADYLIQKGCRVTVVEEMDHSPVIPMTAHGSYLHKVLRKKGELLLNTRVVQVTPKGAIISTRGEEREMEADTVVWAVGSEPELEVVEAARELDIEVKVVGDAVEPRRLLEAVHEGYQAAQEFLGSSPE
jgi:2,4-dienoyl-CoA reductase-like NADH-dependent reductase (Old Yellow Enzyme family)/thioredoxin reductase